MDGTGAIEVRKHRKLFWTAAAVVVLIAIGCLTATSMRTAAIKTEAANAQSPAIETAESAKGDITPTAFEIVPSPVVEPNPGFFFGAGDGSNGYYAERPAR